MSSPTVCNPRAEASALLPEGHEARVLEPSPPASTDPDWFADFHDPLTPGDPAAELPVDPAASRVLGDWFGFATAVLEELRRTDGARQVGRVQLWPEHFDPAVELGDRGADQRASYGASPGDVDHEQPYLYVAAWAEIDRTVPFWNDGAFNGASITYRELQATADPFETALDFLRTGHRILTGSPAGQVA